MPFILIELVLVGTGIAIGYPPLTIAAIVCALIVLVIEVLKF